MNLIFMAKLITLFSFCISSFLLAYKIIKFAKYPEIKNYSTPKGKWFKGVIYALTLGMAPWAKESTRKHWILYLRGILFHTGIFSALLVVLFTFLFNSFPYPLLLILLLLTGAGTLMGFAGIFLRTLEKNLKNISTLDDHLSLWLVIIFLLSTTLYLLFPSALLLMLLSFSVLLIYLPFSKIRHFIYFFFSRIQFGKFLGTRGILYKIKVNHGK